MDKKALIQQRHDILMLLYAKRLEECSREKLYMAQKDLKDALGDCFFNLRLLTEAGYIECEEFCIDDSGFEYRISASGVEKYESFEQ